MFNFAIRSIGKATGHKSAAELPQPLQAAAPLRQTLAEQWLKLTAVMLKSFGTAQHARELQQAAAQQIDLAAYAFQGIVDELASVMTLPSRRELAVIHLFEPALPRHAIRGALAA